MNKMLLTILLLVLAAYGQQTIAIINTMDDEEPPIKASDLNYLTDRLREIANKTLPQKSYAVMTQQSILSLFASPEDMISKCSELAGCLVKIGREIAADYIAQGRIGRFGKDYTIKVELYESMSGHLVSSFTGNAKDIYGLLAILNAKAPEAFKKIIPKSAQEICKDEGNTWVNGRCKTVSELVDDCEAAGKVWEKNACRAKTKREVCEAGGKVWENGVCKAMPVISVSPSVGNVLTDSRDGKKYKIVKIGNQIWMAENLNYNESGSKCYDNKPNNCIKYGRLYNWYDAINACPRGWHLPSDDEWQTLVNLAGGKYAAAGKLKAKSNNGTDEYGFSALPGGHGFSDGSFGFVSGGGWWWSSTEYNAAVVYLLNMGSGGPEVFWLSHNKSSLHSVRCLRD